MIKSELITALSAKLPHIPERDISLSTNLVLEHLSEVLGNGGRIEVRGFGSFSLHYHPPRNAHNPKTGDRVITNPKYTPHFKPGKALRDRVDAAKDSVPIHGNLIDTEDESGS